MKIIITQIARNNKVSKAGKPYVSLGIKCNEHGDQFINGFGNKENENWKIGDTVDVNIVEKGEYLNFEMPKATFQKSGGMSDDDKATIKRIDANALANNIILNDVKKVLSEILRNLTLSGTLKEHTSDGREMPTF